jgi:hypothetical protein
MTEKKLASVNRKGAVWVNTNIKASLLIKELEIGYNLAVCRNPTNLGSQVKGQNSCSTFT